MGLHHGCIAMTQILCHNNERRAGHYGETCPGMPKLMKRKLGIDSRVYDGLFKRTELMIPFPARSIGFPDKRFVRRSACHESPA
jgi:hypothetical protein